MRPPSHQKARAYYEEENKKYTTASGTIAHLLDGDPELRIHDQSKHRQGI